jgi:uncharacterized protein (TIGR03437 family)
MDLASGNITAIAGTGVRAGLNSNDMGPGLNSSIGLVQGMAVDSSGNLFFADFTSAHVRKIDSKGNVSAVAGAGGFGLLPRDGVLATSAIMLPMSVAFDGSGNMLVADFNLDLVFKVNPVDGKITIVAGNAITGFSGDNGPPTQAELDTPRGVSVSPADGSIYFCDWGNSRVRKVQGTITTVAGTDIKDGGPATSAFLNLPGGLAVDGNGKIAVADTINFALRAFTVGGTINSFGQLNFSEPNSVAVDQSGNFYVTDTEPAVLKISIGGTTTKLAGSSSDTGDLEGIAVDSALNVYVVDHNKLNIRKITPSGGTSIIAGNGKQKASGDNEPATAAGMDPFDVAIDGKQNLYVADVINNRIRKITPDGNITTVAGTGGLGYSGDGGLATNAMLAVPTGVAVDNAGNLYICDAGNAVVRRVTAGGLITTIAGNEVPYPATGDGGLATSAQVAPFRIAVDTAGNVYVSDSANDRIRKLTPKAVTPASIKITGGNNQSATTGAKLSAPLSVQVLDATGAGVPGVIISFTVSPAGAATVSPAITLNDGTASAAVTLGNTAGTITITASAAGASGNAVFTVTAKLPASATAPAISAGGVVSAGLSIPAVRALSPNAIASVFGVNFAPAGTARSVSSADLVNGKLPTTLAGACVQVGGLPAPIFAVFAGQINFQVPAVATGNGTVQVTSNCGASNSQTSNAEPVTIQATAPEFFYFATNSDGHNPIAALNAVSGVYVGAPGLLAGVSFVPAKPGDILTLFATGFGATNPAFGPGELPGTAAQVTASFSISIGGVTLDSTDIFYVGVSPFAGLYQVNLRVPAAVPDGDQPLVITVGGVASPANAFITVAH